MQTKLELAAQFVNSTANHIFLTGKAGTGKTTFLHDLAKATHKNYVVVAPTGIAALNAKGVTIHSQFLLPFGSYLPQPAHFDQAPQTNFYTRKELASKHALNSLRKKVLRNIDLLIIDEVSMLRADLLDAIDYRMRSVKSNYNQPFGGVQLLMIGDLYQLPPIVKEYEWNYLKTSYASPHFFEALALKESGFTYIELDRIFRQSDDDFIRVLNALRNDNCTQADLDLLNSRYSQSQISEEGVITLTTHNYLADQKNREALDKLDSTSSYYEAVVDKDFPENLFPLPFSLELRVGAQVMFVKNDTSEQKSFYNGKLAQVKELKEDGICVSMEGNSEFWLDRHEWENKKYIVNSTNQELDEEVVGSFSQFPIRLAWAITVHKSQGLTFDKAVIDVGQAFAPGQVYVALSRLRSLEGLILRTKISNEVISNDKEVVRFSKGQMAPDTLSTQLETGQAHYIYDLINRTFDFSAILSQLNYTQQKSAGKLEFEDVEMQSALDNLRAAFEAEQLNTRKFRSQLARLLQARDMDAVLARLSKGSDYYQGFLSKKLYELLVHLEEVKQFTRTKTYSNALEEIDQLISAQMSQTQKVLFLSQCVIEKRKIIKSPGFEDERKAQRQRILEEVAKHIKENPKNFSTKTGKKKKKATIKGETFTKTYDLLKEGLDPQQIAEKRDLALSTIESHLSKGVKEGLIEIDSVIKADEMQDIINGFKGNGNLNEVFRILDGKYSYGKLRMVQSHLNQGK